MGEALFVSTRCRWLFVLWSLYGKLLSRSSRLVNRLYITTSIISGGKC